MTVEEIAQLEKDYAHAWEWFEAAISLARRRGLMVGMRAKMAYEMRAAARARIRELAMSYPAASVSKDF